MNQSNEKDLHRFLDQIFDVRFTSKEFNREMRKTKHKSKEKKISKLFKIYKEVLNSIHHKKYTLNQLEKHYNDKKTTTNKDKIKQYLIKKMKRKGKKNKTFSHSKINKILKESALLEHKTIHSFSNRNTTTRKQIKIIKLPINHFRCPNHYRRHPTKKKYCIKEQNIDQHNKTSKYQTILAKKKRNIYLKSRDKKCPIGYHRNPKNNMECIYYRNWYRK